jgi:hypothetical protein
MPPRRASQILIYRELADTVATQAHASVTNPPLLCRLARTAATLGQTAAMLERSLIRYHQKPAPFFGTVLSDAVDIPAVDAMWCGNPGQPPPAPDAAVRHPPDPPNASPPAQPTPPAAALTPTEPQPQPDPPPDPAEDPAPDAPAPDATTSVWTRTRWTRAPAGPARSCATAPARQAATAQSPEPPRDDVSPMPRQARPQPTRWRPPLPRNPPACPTAAHRQPARQPQPGAARSLPAGLPRGISAPLR